MISKSTRQLGYNGSKEKSIHRHGGKCVFDEKWGRFSREGRSFLENREREEMPPRAEMWAEKYKVEDEAGCG